MKIDQRQRGPARPRPETGPTRGGLSQAEIAVCIGRGEAYLARRAKHVRPLTITARRVFAPGTWQNPGAPGAGADAPRRGIAVHVRRPEAR